LLRASIAALDLFAKRSRSSPYCSRYREKIRLALDALATAKNFNNPTVFRSGRSLHFWVAARVDCRVQNSGETPGCMDGPAGVPVCTARAIASVSPCTRRARDGQKHCSSGAMHRIWADSVLPGIFEIIYQHEHHSFI